MLWVEGKHNYCETITTGEEDALRRASRGGQRSPEAGRETPLL
jgi:hypothetical protein